MAIYTLFILVALVAQLAGADQHMEKLNTYVKHHSDLMSKEIEHRLSQGTKRKASVHSSKQVSDLDPVHHSKLLFALEPSAEPTAEPTTQPSANPTAQHSENPNVSLTGYFYLTESFRHDCSQPVLSYGVPINTCFVQSNYGYKIRIVDGNFFLCIFRTYCVLRSYSLHAFRRRGLE